MIGASHCRKYKGKIHKISRAGDGPKKRALIYIILRKAMSLKLVVVILNAK